MDIIYSGNVCPFMHISWGWYILSVFVVFGFGALWYGKLFSKKWVQAVQYKCVCGADLGKGEECTCKKNSMLPMLFQFLATILLGLMYFVLTGVSVWIAFLVVIGIGGWMKASLKFRIADWKRFVTLATIDVGYFFIASLLFIGFAKL